MKGKNKNNVRKLKGQKALIFKRDEKKINIVKWNNNNNNNFWVLTQCFLLLLLIFFIKSSVSWKMMSLYKEYHRKM